MCLSNLFKALTMSIEIYLTMLEVIYDNKGITSTELFKQLNQKLPKEKIGKTAFYEYLEKLKKTGLITSEKSHSATIPAVLEVVENKRSEVRQIPKTLNLLNSLALI